LRVRLDTLGDRELRDLAARAESLRADPAAGIGKKGVIVIAVAVVALVVIIAGIKESCRENPQECDIN
jgi:hypothetical protein